MRTRVGKWADLPRRLLTGIIGVPLAIVLIVAGFPVYFVLGIIAALFTTQEYCRLVNQQNKFGWAIAYFLVAVCLVSALFNDYTIYFVLCVAILIGGFLGSYFMRRGWEYYVPNYVYFVLGSVYIGLPISLLLVVRGLPTETRGLPEGAWWLLMFLFTNWGTDTFALLGGRLFGTHKLAPTISPGKTIEGAVIGYICGAVSGFMIAQLGGLDLTHTLMACISVPLLTIIGDLLESWIKRRYHVKDSGNILPGHGGFLDRIDGILTAAPVFYIILMWL